MYSISEYVSTLNENTHTSYCLSSDVFHRKTMKKTDVYVQAKYEEGWKQHTAHKGEEEEKR